MQLDHALQLDWPSPPGLAAGGEGQEHSDPVIDHTTNNKRDSRRVSTRNASYSLAGLKSPLSLDEAVRRALASRRVGTLRGLAGRGWERFVRTISPG